MHSSKHKRRYPSQKKETLSKTREILLTPSTAMFIFNINFKDVDMRVCVQKKREEKR